MSEAERDFPSDWVPRLAHVIAAAVDEFAQTLHATPVVLLAVDCHPWHGLLEMSLLTAAEAEADKLLCDAGEMAAWRFFHFTVGLKSWQPAASLGREMQTRYDNATDREVIAEAFLRAAARAAASPEVGRAIEKLKRAEGFRISVMHPDHRIEYLHSSGEAGSN